MSEIRVTKIYTDTKLKITNNLSTKIEITWSSFHFNIYIYIYIYSHPQIVYSGVHWKPHRSSAESAGFHLISTEIVTGKICQRCKIYQIWLHLAQWDWCWTQSTRLYYINTSWIYCYRWIGKSCIGKCDCMEKQSPIPRDLLIELRLFIVDDGLKSLYLRDE